MNTYHSGWETSEIFQSILENSPWYLYTFYEVTLKSTWGVFYTGKGGSCSSETGLLKLLCKIWVWTCSGHRSTVRMGSHKNMEYVPQAYLLNGSITLLIM